jgi:hypothetical protein
MRLLHDCYVQRYFAPGDTNVFTGPSKMPDDPDYDSRLADTLLQLKRLKPAITIQEPFRVTQSHQAYHLGGKRSEAGGR